jgi:hypothetical protein
MFPTVNRSMLFCEHTPDTTLSMPFCEPKQMEIEFSMVVYNLVIILEKFIYVLCYGSLTADSCFA